MTSLQFLWAESNGFTGTIPVSWSAMTALQNLDVSANHLTGTIPDAWSAMTALAYLDVSSNQLTGTLPASWSAMRALATLHVSYNQVKGSLPHSWSALKALTYLDVSFNQLTGTVPDSWSALGLENLVMMNNQLTGCLDICMFPAPNGVAAYNNNFSGAFNFSCLSAADSCSYLWSNLFSGNNFCGSECGLLPCTNCTAVVDTAAEGPNIAVSEVSSQAACCAACLRQVHCVATEWYAATGVCIMKSAVGTRSSKPNTTLLLKSQGC